LPGVEGGHADPTLRRPPDQVRGAAGAVLVLLVPQGDQSHARGAARQGFAQHPGVAALPEILLGLALVREARAEPARQLLPPGDPGAGAAAGAAVDPLPPGAPPLRRVLLARQGQEQLRGDVQVLTALVEEEVAAAGAARHAEGTARFRPCQLLDFLAD